jgi:viroplasmin and RNaseH domain-containing protein
LVSNFTLKNLIYCLLLRADCEAQVKGFSGARYKKFSTKNEAIEFINAVGDPYNRPGPSEKETGKKQPAAGPKVNKSKKPKYEVASSCSNELDDSDEDLSGFESDDKFDRIKEQIKHSVDKKINFSFSIH